MADIYTALAAVMAEVDHVAKRDRNTHQNFNFRGIDAVVNAVGPALRSHGVIVTPTVDHVSYDVVQTSTGKPATACRILATFTFWASDGSSLPCSVAAEAWDAGDKAAPKAMSVAFRTALLQALALPTDEADPDSQNYERAAAPRQSQAEPTVTENPNAISGAQLTKIAILAKELGLATREMGLAYYADVIGRQVASSKELTKAEASKCIEAMVAELDLRKASQ